MFCFLKVPMTTEVAQKIEGGLGGVENWSKRSFPKFNQLSLRSCNTSSSQLQPSSTHGQSPAMSKLCIQSLKGAITVSARVVLPFTTVVVRTHTHTPAHHQTSWDDQCSAMQLSWLEEHDHRAKSYLQL